MSTTATTPAPTETPPPAATPSPTPEITADNFDVSGMSVAQLAEIQRAAEHLPAHAPAPVAAPKPAEDAEATKQGEGETKPPAETVATKPPVEPKADETVPERFRPRLTNEEDVAIAMIAKRENVTLREAARIYEKGIEGTRPPAQTPEAQPDLVQDITAAIAETKTAMAEIQKKIDKEAADMNTAEALKLQNQLFEHRLHLRDLEGNRQNVVTSRENAVESARQIAQKEDYRAALERYPMLAPPAKGEQPSEVRQRFNEFVAERQQHPDYQDVFASPRWRSLLVNEFASLNGLPATRKGEAAPAAPQEPQRISASQPPAPKPRQAAAATVLTTQDAPESSSTFHATPEEVSRAIESMNPKQLGELMREVGRLKK